MLLSSVVEIWLLSIAVDSKACSQAWFLNSAQSQSEPPQPSCRVSAKAVYLIHSISGNRPVRTCVCGYLKAWFTSPEWIYCTYFSVSVNWSGCAGNHLSNLCEEMGWLICAYVCETNHMSFCFKPVGNIKSVFWNMCWHISEKKVSHSIKQAVRCLLEPCHTLKGWRQIHSYQNLYWKQTLMGEKSLQHKKLFFSTMLIIAAA